MPGPDGRGPVDGIPTRGPALNIDLTKEEIELLIKQMNQIDKATYKVLKHTRLIRPEERKRAEGLQQQALMIKKKLELAEKVITNQF